MWCPICCADVAAELSLDERRLSCAQCHMELSQTSHIIRPARPGPHPLSTEASELLARWSAEQLLVNDIRTLTSSATPLPSEDSGELPVENDHEGEEQHDSLSSCPLQGPDAPAATPKSTSAAQGNHAKPASWKLHASQIGASLGALLMTCGTGMVISGHYSGQPRRAVTGWLIATLGQMILFLGVISLVFQGLEQLRTDFIQESRRFRLQLRRREKSRGLTADSAAPIALSPSAPASGTTAPKTIRTHRRAA